jgi:hypothetical protein
LADARVVVIAVSSSDAELGGFVERGPVGVAVVDDQFDERPEVALDAVEQLA